MNNRKREHLFGLLVLLCIAGCACQFYAVGVECEFPCSAASS